MKTLLIGGGLLGLSTAKVLQDNHHEVELLEAREGIGLEASYANGGMLTASMSNPWNAPGVYKRLMTSLFDPYSPMKLSIGSIPSLFFWGLKFLHNSSRSRYSETTSANYQLSQYAKAKTTELCERLGLQHAISYRGALKIFRDRRAMEGPRALAIHLAKSGLEYDELDAEGAIEIEPQLSAIRDKIASALYFPEDACGDANFFCHALANEIVKDGGLIRPGVKVSSLVVDKGRVIGVKTAAGFVAANRVVIAAGAHTPALLKGTGISLPIKPVKGYSLTFSADDVESLPKVPVINDAMYAAIVPLGNRLRAVGTAEFTGYDTSIQQDRINNLFHLLQGLYPDIAADIDRAKAEPWAGLRPVSCDGKPFIGPCAIKGLYFNVGHGHLGWTMAMGSAYMLADLLAGHRPAIDSESFRVNR